MNVVFNDPFANPAIEPFKHLSPVSINSNHSLFAFETLSRRYLDPWVKSKRIAHMVPINSFQTFKKTAVLQAANWISQFRPGHQVQKPRKPKGRNRYIEDLII